MSSKYRTVKQYTRLYQAVTKAGREQGVPRNISRAMVQVLRVGTMAIPRSR